jgi:hypothetical protein
MNAVPTGLGPSTSLPGTHVPGSHIPPLRGWGLDVTPSTIDATLKAH